MIRRPPRSTRKESSAASDVYKRQGVVIGPFIAILFFFILSIIYSGSGVPVSYTHLRAHETRHDLVCRLLLEKKKTSRH
ncbi:hypothetical protein CDFC105_43981 [Clostridioides difficile]|nr:hypothetical protein CDFC105_43981 [Clostridioides difficile]